MKYTSYNEEDKKKWQSDLSDAEISALSSMAASGALLGVSKNRLDAGDLTGRELVYHGATKDNAEKILEQGLSARKANDPNNLTRQGLKHIQGDQFDDLTYVARNPLPAYAVNYQRTSVPNSAQKGRKLRMSDQAVLKARIPSWQMKIVDNPELMGADTADEYVRRRVQARKSKGLTDASMRFDIGKGYKTRLSDRLQYWGLSRKGTHTISGDVKPEYFLKSKKYKPATTKEVANFIKHNPRRFARGAAPVLASSILAGNAVRQYGKVQDRDAQKAACDAASLYILEKMAAYSYDAPPELPKDHSIRNTAIGGAVLGAGLGAGVTAAASKLPGPIRFGMRAVGLGSLTPKKGEQLTKGLQRVGRYGAIGAGIGAGIGVPLQIAKQKQNQEQADYQKLMLNYELRRAQAAMQPHLMQ